MQLKLLRAVLDRALSDGHIHSVNLLADIGHTTMTFKVSSYEGDLQISITPGVGLKDVQSELYHEIVGAHRNA